MDWHEYGREAARKLAETPYGEREWALNQYARSLGPKAPNIHTLRRAVSALTALERLKSLDDSFPQHELLETAPLAVVEIAARWVREDMPTARERLAEWARDSRSVDWLTQKFKDRKKPASDKRGRTMKEGYRTAARIAVLEAVESYFLRVGVATSRHDLNVVLPYEPEEHRVLDADLTTYRLENPRERIGVVIVGPYQNPRFYEDRVRDWVARAFALAWIYDQIFLVLPPGAPVDLYKASCNGFRSGDPEAPEVHVVAIDTPTQTKPWAKADSNRK
jgi:hypothetical protein